MSSFFGAWIVGKRRRRAVMISDVSSTDSVVCVTYASRASGGNSSRSDVLDGLDEDDRLRRLAHRADDLLVALVADQDDRVAGGGVAPRLHVHLGDERARRVDRAQLPRGGVRVHRRRDAVRREDDRLALRAPRSPRRRRPRRAPRDRARRAGCGRSACGRRPAARTARVPSRPSRPRARPRRSSRGGTRVGPS